MDHLNQHLGIGKDTSQIDCQHGRNSGARSSCIKGDSFSWETSLTRTFSQSLGSLGRPGRRATFVNSLVRLVVSPKQFGKAPRKEFTDSLQAAFVLASISKCLLLLSESWHYSDYRARTCWSLPRIGGMLAQGTSVHSEWGGAPRV